jgi:hypothetical protein
MKKNMTVVEAGDLCSFAEKAMAIPYNKAHQILFGQDQILDNDYPGEIHLDELDEYGWSAETKKILTRFMEKEKLDKFLLVR